MQRRIIEDRQLDEAALGLAAPAALAKAEVMAPEALAMNESMAADALAKTPDVEFWAGAGASTGRSSATESRFSAASRGESLSWSGRVLRWCFCSA